MHTLPGHSITYRIAVGSQGVQGVYAACDTEGSFRAAVGKIAGFSLNAGVATNPMKGTRRNGSVVTSVVQQYRKSDCR